MNINYHQLIDQFLQNAKMIRSRPGYDLYVGILKANSKKVFVKHFRGEGGFELAEITFNDYQFYYTVLSLRKEYGVPKPVEVFPDRNGGGFYVCEWIYGVNVASLLGFFKYSKNITELILRKTGVYLFEFHNVNKLQNKPFGEIVDRLIINRQIDIVENYLKLHNIDVFGCLFKIRLILNSKKHESELIPFTRIHGDFWSKNLLFNISRTVGVDISINKYGSIYSDVAKFVNYMIEFHNVDSNELDVKSIEYRSQTIFSCYANRGDVHISMEYFMVFFCLDLIERISNFIISPRMLDDKKSDWIHFRIRYLINLLDWISRKSIFVMF